MRGDTASFDVPAKPARCMVGACEAPILSALSGHCLCGTGHGCNIFADFCQLADICLAMHGHMEDRIQHCRLVRPIPWWSMSV